MTYNVSSGTLNPTLSLTQTENVSAVYFATIMMLFIFDIDLVVFIYDRLLEHIIAQNVANFRVCIRVLGDVQY